MNLAQKSNLDKISPKHTIELLNKLSSRIIKHVAIFDLNPKYVYQMVDLVICNMEIFFQWKTVLSFWETLDRYFLWLELFYNAPLSTCY